MKKTNKPNPLKVFNDNKAMAYKKAGGAMKAFKKSLPKAQDGIIQGPLTEAGLYMYNQEKTKNSTAGNAAAESIRKADLNPNNSEKLSRGKSNRVYSKQIEKDKVSKLVTKEEKKEYRKSKAGKTDRNILATGLGVAAGITTGLASTDNPIRRKFRKAWNLPKDKIGGTVNKMKVGGSTKASNFAALAPPYNKATAADRIAGAKKNARKK
jgi:hypothetical protein